MCSRLYRKDTEDVRSTEHSLIFCSFACFASAQWSRSHADHTVHAYAAHAVYACAHAAPQARPQPPEPKGDLPRVGFGCFFFSSYQQLQHQPYYRTILSSSGKSSSFSTFISCTF